MPANLPVANVLQSSIRIDIFGTPTHMVINHHDSGVPTQADCDALALAVVNSYGPRLMPELSNNAQLIQVDTLDLTAGSVLGATAVSGTVGGTADESVPLNTAVIVQWGITSRYRGGQPRSYLPGIGDESLQSPRQLTIARTAALKAKMDLIFTDLNVVALSGGHTGTMVTIHRQRAHVQLNPPQIEVILGVTQVDSILGTQRRRMARL